MSYVRKMLTNVPGCKINQKAFDTCIRMILEIVRGLRKRKTIER